jgi:hypothetical protein
MLYGRCVRRVIAAVLLTAVASSVAAQIPPISISTPKEQVDDEFLAYLHGLLYQDLELWTDGVTLLREFPEFLPEIPSPIYDFEIFARSPAGQLTFAFSVPLRHKIPLDIFGLEPAELRGSRVIRLREIVRPSGPGLPDGLEAPPDTTDLMILEMTTGYLLVDFAPWLDVLAWRFLDDVDVTLIAVLRHRGRWLALMGGWNPKGRPLVWVFNMSNSRIMVSPPRALTRFGRALVELETSNRRPGGATISP